MKLPLDLQTILNSSNYFSPEWKLKHEALWHPEHWNCFALRLWQLLYEEHLETPRLPPCEDEITPDLLGLKNHFIKEFEKHPNINAHTVALTLEEIGLETILLVLGQRLTPASAKDAHAIPPLKKTLLQSAFQAYNTEISKATRAWEKHLGRSNDQFWGIKKGNNNQKEAFVRNLLIDIINDKTWWNTFYHYKHALVYEIRIASGHGIRWNYKGTQLIGFLEPFIINTTNHGQ